MTEWKDHIRSFACSAYKSSGAMGLHEWVSRRLGTLSMSILLFHRVTDLISEDGLTVSPDRFRKTVELLARRFRVVPLAEIFRIVRSGEPFPARTVAITFDDCYLDNRAAAEVLAEYGLPATFFIPTEFVGTTKTFFWDRELPAMPNLNWSDVRAIQDMGFEIGSHTLTHANLGKVGPDRARQEIFESKRVLEEKLGKRVLHLAYPFGGRHHFKREYLPLVSEAGYNGLVSAFGGFVHRGCDGEPLPRHNIANFRSLPHLEIFLSGCLNWLYSIKGNWPGQYVYPHLDEEEAQGQRSTDSSDGPPRSPSHPANS